MPDNRIPLDETFRRFIDALSDGFVVSGYVDRENSWEVVSLKEIRMLAKPYTMTMLLANIKEILRKNQKQDRKL
jgi:hypothetical protein